MRRGVVPNPNSEPLVGRGQLTSVWLGGLANPAALVTSLKHEKAAMVGCRVDEVKLYLFFFFFFFLNTFQLIYVVQVFIMITRP